MKYTEYPKPIPVQFFNAMGLRSGEALGVRETPLTNGKCDYHFLVRFADGSAVMVSQRDILPSDPIRG